ncbi:MAG: hypothetical protein M0Z63_07380 [Actinomycetota bacterium]|nr:hypothetical protein [Actinomycetota bacterium]
MNSPGLNAREADVQPPCLAATLPTGGATPPGALALPGGTTLPGVGAA